jgi:sporulation protein YlmC with PRC-barrel domain
MAHYGLLRDYRFEDLSPTHDIRGRNVYGRDHEQLGKVEDVIFDHETGTIRYVVVGTAGWFSKKKFLVPSHRLHAASRHENDFAVNLDKEQVESLPEYKESDLESQKKWNDYEKRHDAAWHAGPIQHRKGSDHDVTPTPEEFPPESGAVGLQLTPSQRAEVNSRIIPATSNEVTIQSSGVGIGSRWLTFEQRLRERRRDLTRGCTTCSVGPTADRASENVEQERKAV